MEAQEDKQRTTVIDETGNRYGKLLVLKRGTKGGKNIGADWICHCDCGRIQSVMGSLLRAGRRTMCNKCAAEARERGEVANIRPPGKPAEVKMQELKYQEAKNTIVRLRKLRKKLQIGEKYIVAMRIPHAEEYRSNCTLIAKYPRYALFESEHGICTCLGYHAIMTEQILFTDELVPRRVTA